MWIGFLFLSIFQLTDIWSIWNIRKIKSYFNIFLAVFDCFETQKGLKDLKHATQTHLHLNVCDLILLVENT